MNYVRLFLFIGFSVLTACGSSGGSSPSTIPGSPSPALPSPVPSGSGVIGGTNVAYVPFRDGAIAIDLRNNTYVSPIVGVPFVGNQIFDRIDISLDGTILYADATGQLGPEVYAWALTGPHFGLLGTQNIFLSQLALGAVQIAPLAGGNVAVVTSSPSGSGGATSFSVFSQDLRTTLQSQVPTTASIASPVEDPSVPGAFFAIDSTQSVVVFTPPSYQQSASTSASGLAFLGPIITDGVSIFATTFNQTQNQTSVYSLNSTTLNPTLVGSVTGALQLRAAAQGRILLYSPSGVGTLAVLTIGQTLSTILPLPSGITALNNLVSQALSADGSKVLLGYDASGVSTVFILDSRTGKLVASLFSSSISNLLPNGQNILGQIRSH